MSFEFDLPDWELEEFIPDDFFDGIEDSVYIKREIMNFHPVFAIYDSTGQRLAQAPTREAAVALAQREDRIPCLVN